MKNNEVEYDAYYGRTSLSGLLLAARHYGEFLDKACAVDTSWVGLYRGDFRNRLKGKRVLELGSGDGLNALLMAKLGAEVTAIDASEVGMALLRQARSALGLEALVNCLCGDVLKMSFPERFFDFVAGKGFLHHIPQELEDRYFSLIASLLKEEGEARFCEPAVNSVLLDAIRWAVPVPGRPSSLNRRAFALWRERDDPHPVRDNSSSYFREACGKHFGRVDIFPFGGIERFQRLLPKAWNRGFRIWAYEAETRLPARLNEWLARAQTIVLRSPHRAQK